MQIRNHYWVPSIIFLISFCLHLSLISKGPVTIDCLNLAIASQDTIETLHLHYLFGSGYPLMVLLGSIFISIGNYLGVADPISSVNFISVLFSSIAVLAFYLLVLRICDALTAIFASFILLFNPIFLDVSTYGINHAPALCFLLLGLLSLLRYQTEGNMPSLLLSALYFGLMGAVRLEDFILTFPAISFMFMLGLKADAPLNKGEKFRHFFLFAATIILIIILFHSPYFIFDHAHYAPQARHFWDIGLTKNFMGLASPFLVSGLRLLLWTFKMTGIICFLIGLFYTAVSNKKLLGFTVLWWIIPLSFYGNLKSLAPRFLSIILPALIIPISIFLAHLLKHKKRLWNLLALIIFLIIILRPLEHTKDTFIRRNHYDLLTDFYRWVGTSTEPNAIIIASDDGLLITHYSRRSILEKPSHTGHLPSQELVDFKKRLDSILDEQKPVYITTLVLHNYDDYLEFWHLMKHHYHLVPVGQRPLELWYQTPYETALRPYGLLKIKK